MLLVLLLCALWLPIEGSAEEDWDRVIDGGKRVSDSYQPLEQANGSLLDDTHRRVEDAPVTEPAPADLVVDIPEERPEANNSSIEKSMEPDMRAVAKIERGKNFERITLKNGDVILNMKGEHDIDRALSGVLGGRPDSVREEVPFRPTEDWAIPSNDKKNNAKK